MRTLPALRVAMGSLLVALTAVTAVEAQRHAPLSDSEVERQVAARILEKQIGGVDVTVSRGNATLRGTVKSLWEKERAAEEAMKVDDVMMVANELTIARGVSDDRIAAQAGLGRSVFFSIFDDADVEVDDGVVILTGRVTAGAKADAFADLVSRVPGVQRIRNRIETLPVSHFDEQLRYGVARQIYGDPAFWPYALQSNPPIHIIVAHGRVTLTGVVRSDVERRKAESIAAGTLGVMSVTNKLRVEREPSTGE